ANHGRVRIPTSNSVEFFGPGDQVSCSVPMPTAHPRHALRLAQFSLALADRFFHALSLGNVNRHADHSRQLTLSREKSAAGSLQPDDSTVWPENAHRDLIHGIFRTDSSYCGNNQRSILRMDRVHHRLSGSVCDVTCQTEDIGGFLISD